MDVGKAEGPRAHGQVIRGMLGQPFIAFDCQPLLVSDLWWNCFLSVAFATTGIDPSQLLLFELRLS